MKNAHSFWSEHPGHRLLRLTGPMGAGIPNGGSGLLQVILPHSNRKAGKRLMEPVQAEELD